MTLDPLTPSHAATSPTPSDGPKWTPSPPDEPPPSITADGVARGAAAGTARAAASFLTTTCPDDPQQASELSMEELKALGKEDKPAFFKALLPGALASERAFGVPASVILAQAALESGWGKHAIGGYNLFGIKGHGPAGGRTVNTREQRNGAWVTVKATFAQYHNFAEAIEEHGKVFLNSCYQKARTRFAADRDPHAFVRSIAPSYASAKNYASSIISIINNYGIVDLVTKAGGY